MAGKTLDIENLLTVDQLGHKIANMYQEWETFRQPMKDRLKELRQYVYATDTTMTSNSKLPWSNKTTVPKLTQIRDNLYANYLATMFPKRKSIFWEGDTAEDELAIKRQAIESYMSWATDRPEFYAEVGKMIIDYIETGNVFAMPTWCDDRYEAEGGVEKGSFVGPRLRRIDPMSIVFNPTAPSFAESPKIVQSIMSKGEAYQLIEKLTAEAGEKEKAQELISYMQMVRERMYEDSATNLHYQDDIYNIAGFGDYRQYLQSDYAEILTFYGDIYDDNTGKFMKNQVVHVVDRHKIITQTDHPSVLGYAPIFHVGWRVRPGNLWAMGPLENLVGMQYRLDHLENMKADIVDLTAYPVVKVRGFVEDFEWAPMEKIVVGDDGDVEMLAPSSQALMLDTQIERLATMMEEMAGSPREAMGFRTPGEKTKYEVQVLNNSSSRIFQNKTAQFERDLLEPSLNAMLEMARRNLTDTTIRVLDDEDSVAMFLELTPADITGNGRVRPVAARNFAEQSNMVQNLNAFFGSAIGQDPDVKAHFSSIKLAKMFENLLDIEHFGVVGENIRIAEQADAQRMANAAQEQVQSEIMTPSGLEEDDADEPFFTEEA